MESRQWTLGRSGIEAHQLHDMKLKENKHLKTVRSDDYNYIFSKENGSFLRWGKDKDDDPEMAPFPEILDIEVTTSCTNGCPFCYKANTGCGKNMSLDTFKTIMSKMVYEGQPFLTQMAIGADASATSNPDLFDMMRHARSIGVIPNITVADISDETADTLSQLCGAVAVSRYEDKDKCYNSVKRLTDRGLRQTNIHIMLSEETLPIVHETFKDYLEDPRLEKLNAIVILSLKRKGRGINHRSVSQAQFKELVDFALEKKIPIGFDSCSQPKFMKSVEGRPEYKRYEMLAEPCESTLFSSYINVDGKFFSCSFCEGHDSFQEGVDVVGCNDFIKDVWFGERTKAWRQKLLDKRRSGDCSCPVFEV